MNKKSMILFICWVTLCVGLVVFMIVHIIVQQNIALHKEAANAAFSIYQLFFGGKRL